MFFGLLLFEEFFFFYLGRDSLYFQVFPWHFYFMRGHSLVELTEHDNSAADIIVHSMYIHICTAAFKVHIVPITQHQ